MNTVFPWGNPYFENTSSCCFCFRTIDLARESHKGTILALKNEKKTSDISELVITSGKEDSTSTADIN